MHGLERAFVAKQRSLPLLREQQLDPTLFLAQRSIVKLRPTMSALSSCPDSAAKEKFRAQAFNRWGWTLCRAPPAALSSAGSPRQSATTQLPHLAERKVEVVVGFLRSCDGGTVLWEVAPVDVASDQTGSNAHLPCSASQRPRPPSRCPKTQRSSLNLPVGCCTAQPC